MNKCPFDHGAKLRPELTTPIPRIAALPVDSRGYPVPFFVQKMPDGNWDFRIADSRKLQACLTLGLCWVCGQAMGKFKTFTIGPMCGINRTTAEPPEHKDCAEWSVKNCPFMTRPHMVRREDELTRAGEEGVAGIMIKRNPGVMLVWTTTTFRPFSDGRGGRLFEIGEPLELSWWREGRKATRAEIIESIESGLPRLRECIPMERPENQATAAADLESKTKAMYKMLPSS